MRKRKKKQRPKWNSKLGNFFCFFQKSTNKQVKWINKNGGDSPAFSAMHHVIVSETSTTDEITLKVLFLFWRWSIGQWLGGCMDCQDRRGSVASCTELHRAKDSSDSNSRFEMFIIDKSLVDGGIAWAVQCLPWWDIQIKNIFMMEPNAVNQMSCVARKRPTMNSGCVAKGWLVNAVKQWPLTDRFEYIFLVFCFA